MGVNVYKADGSSKIVIPEAKLQEYLAAGYISEDAWKELCAERDLAARQAWLDDPETLEERFEMLRQARDAKIATTDYLVAADYPIASERLEEVKIYRQELRDLPAQEGAPWDGGGALTPWPEKIAL